MNREYSAGAVVYRMDGDEPFFLLVFSRKNDNWGFPKGHIEAGEDERGAARREIAEETGIGTVSFVEGFREEQVYPAIGKRAPFRGEEIEKHSTYFLCRTDEDEVTVDGHEIVDYRWLTFGEAESLLPFANVKTLLRKARDLIQK